MKSIRTSCLVAAHALATLAAVPGPAAADNGAMALHPPAAIQWKDGPASLPAGSQFAVLEGDPAKEGPFVMRLRFPHAYRIAPHFHPKVERLTVIAGTFQLGMGDKFEASALKNMPAGTYGYWPAGMTHFASTSGETVLQLHGVGPWSITYVDPSDDPRKAAR